MLKEQLILAQRSVTVVLLVGLALAVSGCGGRLAAAQPSATQPVEHAICIGSDAQSAGVISCGTNLDASSLTLSCVTSVFPSGSPWAWRAQLAQPITPGTINVVIARTFTSGAAEQAVWTQPETVSGPSTIAYGAQGDQGFLARLGPGIYMMRILVGTSVSAAGSFSVTR